MAVIKDTLGRILVSDLAIEIDADLLRIAIRENVDLRNADLSRWDLSGMDLSGLDLSFASFTDADLTDTSLRDSVMARANFNRADIRGADFSRADVRGASFFGARIDKETRFKDVFFHGSEFIGSIVEGKHELAEERLLRRTTRIES